MSLLGLMVNLSEAEYKGGGPHFGGKIKILVLDKLIEISVLNNESFVSSKCLITETTRAMINQVDVG